jgi:hypothetical protein
LIKLNFRFYLNEKAVHASGSNKTHTKEQQAADVKFAAVVGVGAIGVGIGLCVKYWLAAATAI